MFKINAMDHIVLNVADIERSMAFYTNVLGLEPERWEEFRDAKVPFPSVRVSPETVIDLFPMKPGQTLASNEGLLNLNHFTMVVDTTDFESFQQHLSAHNVKIEEGPGGAGGLGDMGCQCISPTRMGIASKCDVILQACEPYLMSRCLAVCIIF